MDRRAHWERVYAEKQPDQMSWYQSEARLSLDLISKFAARPDTAIVDVGGGASRFVDGLLASGYHDVRVLDLSAAALTAEFAPQSVDVWHDRAVFHFLTEATDRARYVEQVRLAVRPGGLLLVATFAEDGPLRCSGLEVARYSPEALHHEFGEDFVVVESRRAEHRTPAGAVQHFTYCLCRYTPPLDPSTRAIAVRRGQFLTWATIAYNSIEAVVALVAGVRAGSVALVGFGLDSVIEVSASSAALWRLRNDADLHARERAERTALRLIGVSFLALAAYVGVDAVRALLAQEPPKASPLGIAIATLSVVVMPLLARAKRRVAAQLSSCALTAEARQTDICMYLSVLLLAGLALNAGLGWWWADPVAALAMVPLIAYEGREAFAGRTVCADCAPVIAG